MPERHIKVQRRMSASRGTVWALFAEVVGLNAFGVTSNNMTFNAVQVVNPYLSAPIGSEIYSDVDVSTSLTTILGSATCIWDARGNAVCDRVVF